MKHRSRIPWVTGLLVSWPAGKEALSGGVFPFKAVFRGGSQGVSVARPAVAAAGP